MSTYPTFRNGIKKKNFKFYFNYWSKNAITKANSALGFEL
jgi:hypothetical protein